MPSVTRLLNRKKLQVGGGRAATPAPAVALVETPVVEIVPEAVESISPVPSTSLEEAQPIISLVPDDASSINPGGGAIIESDDAALPSVVAPGRRRGTRSIDVNAGVVSVSGATNGPPIFSRTLILEQLDLKGFQKAIGKHKKSSNLKKLDCLGYFSTRFTEIGYFEVSEAGALAGVLGFGNQKLVVQLKSQAITAELLPSIFEAISQGEIFVGPIESLRAEDQAGFGELGFTQAAFVGAFPVMYKKAVTGLWLCGSGAAQDIPQKEIAALKKFLSNFVL